MSKFILAMAVLLIVGCSTQPMTPQEAERYRRMGDAFSGLSNDLNQQSQQNYQRMNRMQEQDCKYSPDGYGGFRSTCDTW